MGVIVEGKWYGLPDKICFSLPCVCQDGKFKVVEGLKWDAFSKSMIDKTLAVKKKIYIFVRNCKRRNKWHLKD